MLKDPLATDDGTLVDDELSLELASGNRATTLVIACGALARELLATIRANRLDHLAVTALPAKLHNRPQLIPEAVRRKIHANRDRYERIMCLYGDCGTGGLLDQVLAEEGVERIEGAHCYAFYTGLDRFDALMEENPAVFFLTDFLVRHFDRLVIQGLGLDRYPQLLKDYFGNYTKVVYLAQLPDATLEAKASAAATRLGMPLEVVHTGLGELEAFLVRADHAQGRQDGAADRHLLA